MGLLQSPVPAQKLARQYGIRGVFTPEIVPSLQPVVLIDDLTQGLSNEPLRIGASTGIQAGVAAEFTTFRFETPPGIIARITRILVTPASSGLVKIFFGSSVVAPATLFTKAFTDGRLRLAGEEPASFLGADTYAVVLAAQHIFLAGHSTANVVKWQEVDWVIGNTTSFDFFEIGNQNANNAMTVALQWTEESIVEVR